MQDQKPLESLLTMTNGKRTCMGRWVREAAQTALQHQCTLLLQLHPWCSALCGVSMVPLCHLHPGRIAQTLSGDHSRPS